MTSLTPDERPICRPLIQTPPPVDVPGAWFDQGAVDRVVRFFLHLRHIKGELAGKALELDPWQVEYLVAPVFGWKDAQGLRIVREAWMEMPRKSAKSTIASGFGLYLLSADRERGAEVYALAGSRRQARQVFDPAVAMVKRGSEDLRERLIPRRSIIQYPAQDSFFEVLAADADLQHGLNVSGAVIDEVHVHKSRDLIDVIETGTGSRRQPLIIYITTADDDDQTSIYDEKRTYVERVAEGIIVDPTTYGVVFAAPDDADPFAERTWELANPGIDRSVHRSFLAVQAKKAKASPGYLPTFKRLHLGIRSRATEDSFFNLEDWDACDLPIPSEDELRGALAFGGLDLASSADFAAWQIVIPHDDGTVTVLSRPFLPEAAVERRGPMQATLRAWAAVDLIDVTPGKSISFDRIKAQVLKDAALLNLRSIGYDPWNALKLVQELTDEGLELEPVPQRLSVMSAPTKELLRLVTEKRLRHGQHPVLRWMADNCVPLIDADENVKPDKKRSKDKIDGIVATVNALQMMIADAATGSFWAANLGVHG